LVVNPIGLVPLYLAVVGNESPAAQRRIARRAVLIALAILVGFVVAGQVMLTAMGVRMNSFRIAGGLVLLIIALRMVVEERVAPGPSSAATGTHRTSRPSHSRCRSSPAPGRSWPSCC